MPTLVTVSIMVEAVPVATSEEFEAPEAGDSLLLENGDSLLLENGDKLLLE